MLTRRQILIQSAALGLAAPALAGPDKRYQFASIDGGTLTLADGRPALVVNTASQCAFTPQYDALQALHEAVGNRLTVLAVPSDDFGGQELANEAAVKEFCTVNFGLTLPMTEISHVRGPNAHPFYRWARRQGVSPSWNFHKILLTGNGAIVSDFPSSTRPDNAGLRRAIDALI